MTTRSRIHTIWDELRRDETLRPTMVYTNDDPTLGVDWAGWNHRLSEVYNGLSEDQRAMLQARADVRTLHDQELTLLANAEGPEAIRAKYVHYFYIMRLLTISKATTPCRRNHQQDDASSQGKTRLGGVYHHGWCGWAGRSASPRVSLFPIFSFQTHVI